MFVPALGWHRYQQQTKRWNELDRPHWNRNRFLFLPLEITFFFGTSFPPPPLAPSHKRGKGRHLSRFRTVAVLHHQWNAFSMGLFFFLTLNPKNAEGKGKGRLTLGIFCLAWRGPRVFNKLSPKTKVVFGAPNLGNMWGWFLSTRHPV